MNFVKVAEQQESVIHSLPSKDGRDMSTLIEMDNVSKVFRSADGGEIRAIESVSGTISTGEFVSVLGPSGCGKSTLMMMLAGLSAPTGGTIRLNGQKVVGPQEKFGIVFQDPVLFPWRTILKNVQLPLELRGLPAGERMDRARQILEIVGLSGFESKYPHELSGGMQQRVSIARALSVDPTLLVMDEPFGALDAMTRDQMNLELQRISADLASTVVFVTHSIVEAVFLSDRVFVMSGRPSSVSAVISIDIPKPRSLSIINQHNFGVYVSKLRSLLGTK